MTLPTGIDGALLFALMAKNNKEGVLLYDSAGTLVYFNDEAQRQRGYLKVGLTLAGLAQKSTYTDRQGRPLSESEIPIARAMAGGVLESAAWVVRRSDGTPQYLSGGAWPIKDAEGRVTYVLATTVDETEELRTKTLNTRLRQQAMLIAEVGADLAGGVALREMIRRVATSVVQRMNGSLLGVWLFNQSTQLLDLETTQGVTSALQPASNHIRLGEGRIGRIAQGKEPYRTNDLCNEPDIADPDWVTREKLVAFVGSPLIVGGQLLGVMAMYLQAPVTDDASDTFGALVSALAVGIAQRRHEVDQAHLFRLLERRNAELSEFANVISHDLKAPLRGMGVLAQLLEEDVGSRLTDGERENVRQIQARSAKLQKLIDGVLSYASVDRQQRVSERVDVGELLNEVASLISAPAPARVVVNIAAPIVLVTQRAPLQQVVLNLITNALKHAGRPDVMVTVTATPLEGGVTIEVNDNGQGIEPLGQRRIWGMFQRLNADSEGTGIGLAVVKKVVEGRGGTVKLTSEPGHGATFEIVWR